MARALLVILALAGLFVLAGCFGYGPKVEDCKVTCGPAGTCPSGTVCKDGMCRPPAAEGFCECSPGDERPCGGGKGACIAGSQRCTNTRVWGQCLGEVKPSSELCDGVDNDCNELVDDNVSGAPACELTQGVCFGRVRACINASFVSVCTEADYGSDYQALETRCDGLDNDCNGTVDQAGPFVLADSANDFTWVHLDGGFGAVYSSNRTGLGHGVYFRHFDGALRPTGAEVYLALLPRRPVYPVAAGAGGVTYAMWGENQGDGGFKLGASQVDSSGSVNALPLPAADEISDRPRMAASPSELVAVWAARGGQRVRGARWTLPAVGAPTVLDYNFPLPDGGLTTEAVDWADVSPMATTVVWVSQGSDAGTSQGYFRPVGGAPAAAFEGYYGTNHFMQGPGTAVSSAWLISSYVPFLWDYSSVRFAPNLASGSTYVTLKRVDGAGAHFIINDVSGVHSAAGPLVAWTESGQRAVVAVPYGSAGATRQKVLDHVDGGIRALQLVNGEGGLAGVSYRPTLGDGLDAYGILFCPP
ncbi:MAG: MopE-related protein [Myxococcaceae bacterium]